METFEQFDRIVLVEEHTAIGGLLGAISEQMVVEGITKKVLAINLPDQFGPTGTYNYLLDYHGLTGEKIAKRIEKFMKNQ